MGKSILVPAVGSAGAAFLVAVETDARVAISVAVVTSVDGFQSVGVVALLSACAFACRFDHQLRFS